jgi:hypothetical protein
MEKKRFYIIDESVVRNVYVGRDCGCRCGCHGKYTYSSLHSGNPYYADINSRRLKSTLTRAWKLLVTRDGQITDCNERYINISHGIDRAITIYLI